jgi:hypothetical protein
MTVETFEYAIKKDVRNNPIVREIDRDRHREMWRAALLGVFLVTVLLFWAWQHFELLRHGIGSSRCSSSESPRRINRHLRLEIESLRAPRRIEEMARTRLRMVGRPATRPS